VCGGSLRASQASSAAATRATKRLVNRLQQNPDVAAAFGARNFYRAILHWNTFGIAEGRKGVP
jgi:hypothetical protein